MSSTQPDETDSEVIIATYKKMSSDCQQIASKISELNMDRDEHRLVVETLTKLEPERKAFRLVGGVLMERTVAEVKPIVEQNFEGVCSYVLALIGSNLNFHVDQGVTRETRCKFASQGCGKKSL